MTISNIGKDNNKKKKTCPFLPLRDKGPPEAIKNTFFCLRYLKEKLWIISR